MDFDDLMRLFYSAVQTLKDGDVKEVEIRREWDIGEVVEVVLRAEANAPKQITHSHEANFYGPVTDETGE